ncbi:hypothetical protein HF882_08485 [Victivallis vadensis]|uniref:Uncharacterized protein n=1 Tax=Victivallis vadensis TaxID=172901 RepID=A0A848B172_9BACT|nr:hypothetical protein [Victivallis vadensis]NMD86616.1 hypothetical protein [Victivallis vadensis]
MPSNPSNRIVSESFPAAASAIPAGKCFPEIAPGFASPAGSGRRNS